MAIGTLAESWLKGALHHGKVVVSNTTNDLRSADANVVHIRRAPPPALRAAPLLSSHVPRSAVSAPIAERPEAAAELLVQGIDQPDLQRAIYEDTVAISRQLLAALPGARTTGLRAKLEVVTRQSCPRWHADTVGVRCLCTYEGPGTFYVPNRAVKRRWGLDGAVSVQAVDEAAAEQAAAWDLLYLKGNAFPGLYGMGAVHKSPEGASEDSPRLLLTVDDAPACSCCQH